jgi:hypothetical protein
MAVTPATARSRGTEPGVQPDSSAPYSSPLTPCAGGGASRRRVSIAVARPMRRPVPDEAPQRPHPETRTRQGCVRAGAGALPLMSRRGGTPVRVGSAGGRWSRTGRGTRADPGSPKPAPSAPKTSGRQGGRGSGTPGVLPAGLVPGEAACMPPAGPGRSRDRRRIPYGPPSPGARHPGVTATARAAGPSGSAPPPRRRPGTGLGGVRAAPAAPGHVNDPRHLLTFLCMCWVLL